MLTPSTFACLHIGFAVVFEVEKCGVHDRDNFDAGLVKVGVREKGAWELVMAKVLLRQGSRCPAGS